MIFFKLATQIFNKNKLLYSIIIIVLVVLNLFVNSFISFFTELNSDKVLTRGLSDRLVYIYNDSSLDEIDIERLIGVKGLYRYTRQNTTGIKPIHISSYDYDLITQLDMPIIEGQYFNEYNGEEFPVIIPQAMGLSIGETITMSYNNINIRYKVIGIVDNFYPYFYYNAGGNNLEIHKIIRWRRAHEMDMEFHCISLTQWKGTQIPDLSNYTAYIQFNDELSQEDYEENLHILQEKYLINEMSVMKQKLNDRIGEEVLKFIPVLVVFVFIAVIGLFIMSYFFIRDSLYITNIFRLHGASSMRTNSILIGFMLIITIINIGINLVLARFMTNPLSKMHNINVNFFTIIVTLCIMAVYWVITLLIYNLMTRHTVSAMLKEGN